LLLYFNYEGKNGNSIRFGLREENESFRFKALA
jgi:hypothetical protein